MKPHITVEELKGLLRLDPDTQRLYWKVNMGVVKAGTEAGGLDRSNAYNYVTILYKRYSIKQILFAFTHGRWPKNSEIRKKSKPLSDIHGIRHNKPWSAYCYYDGKQRGLGSFDEQWDAICARKSAEVTYNL